MTERVSEQEVRAMVVALESAEFTAKALSGKQEGRARLTLWLPVDTVRELWRLGRAIRQEDGEKQA